MPRIPTLSSPFLLGFEEIERALDRVTKGADGYPPYNIERLRGADGAPEMLRITLEIGFKFIGANVRLSMTPLDDIAVDKPSTKPSRLRQLWIKLTYWPVKCPSCNGTGICTTLQAGAPPSVPHSCCGDCGRKRVPRSQVPDDFAPLSADPVTIGDGVLWRRPWSRDDVKRPL